MPTSEERLNNAVVRVGPSSNRDNPACGTITAAQTSAYQKIEINCDLRGQYLSIELTPGTTHLHICEVQADTGLCEGKDNIRYGDA